MPLANIFKAPSPALQRAYDFSHWLDHLEILQAIRKQQSTNLPTYPIYPVMQSAPQRVGSDWQRQHQAMHNDMNLTLKLPQGRDLIGEMTPDWYYRNWQEHQAARSKLGI